MEPKLYTYDGPVLHFGKVITSKWHGETMAVSERKARSNLCYKFKSEFNFVKNTPVELFGKVVCSNKKPVPKKNTTYTDISMF